MRYLFLLIFFFNNLAYGQIIVDSKNEYSIRIDSALTLIKTYDPEAYALVDSVCFKILVWDRIYSSAEDSSIFISSSDFKLNSINNIACAIVHESIHMYFENCRKGCLCNAPETHVAEEKYCYSYEYDFFSRLPAGEDWLKLHILREIVRYSE